ncbi:uncharacterized protein [Vicugna pacos]|uniref:Uncharacterized protein n=1 Tax=Vicugna pacos TaxID=30538 RepID=A0ABM5C8K4_VICPA
MLPEAGTEASRGFQRPPSIVSRGAWLRQPGGALENIVGAECPGLNVRASSCELLPSGIKRKKWNCVFPLKRTQNLRRWRKCIFHPYNYGGKDGISLAGTPHSLRTPKIVSKRCRGSCKKGTFPCALPPAPPVVTPSVTVARYQNQVADAGLNNHHQSQDTELFIPMKELPVLSLYINPLCIPVPSQAAICSSSLQFCHFDSVTGVESHGISICFN